MTKQDLSVFFTALENREVFLTNWEGNDKPAIERWLLSQNFETTTNACGFMDDLDGTHYIKDGYLVTVVTAKTPVIFTQLEADFPEDEEEDD